MIEIVEEAKKWLKVKYVLGGKTKAGVDCSGLVWRVYENCGYIFPYASASTFSSLDGKYFRRRKMDEKKENGDVILWHGHMGIYTKGKTISAQSGKGMVNLGEIKWFGTVKGYYTWDKK